MVVPLVVAGALGLAGLYGAAEAGLSGRDVVSGFGSGIGRLTGGLAGGAVGGASQGGRFTGYREEAAFLTTADALKLAGGAAVGLGVGTVAAGALGVGPLAAVAETRPVQRARSAIRRRRGKKRKKRKTRKRRKSRG